MPENTDGRKFAALWQGLRGKLSEGNAMDEQERPGRTIIRKKRKHGRIDTASYRSDTSEPQLQPADLLGEDFATQGPPEAAVSESAIEMGKTRQQEILGHGMNKRAYCVQHGVDAVRPGHVALVITGQATDYDPTTMNREPCHVLKFENGAISYLPMSLPGYPLGQVPWKVRKFSRRWSEWVFESDDKGVSMTYVTRLIKGRPVE